VRPLCAAVLTTVGIVSAANSGPALFTTYDPISLRIEAPFTELFGHKSIDDDYSVKGRLKYSDAGREVSIEDVTLSVRGHTSRREGECTFPKLKLDLSSDDTLFGGMKSVKIGTHCGESSGNRLTERFGRLPNQLAPPREAFVYRLLAIFDVPTLRARPARIAYVDTDRGGSLRGGVPGANVIERNALLVESDRDAMRRLNGSRDIPPEEFTTAREAFSTDDTARLAFAQAMIGNFDWCLEFYRGDAYRCDQRRKLWNVTAIAVDRGARPLIYDFDVSGMVAGRHRWFGDVYNEAFDGAGSHPVLEVLGQVQRTRTLFPRAVLDATRAYFAGRKDEAYKALAASNLDDEGRAIIREYLDSFFAAIERDEAFYRPVVTTPGVKPFADAARSRAICAALGAIPVGTPISAPLDTRGDMIQVTVLDALWHWAPPAKCPDIHNSAVWIPANAVARDYPAK
jgi:hypothetical protein